MTKRRVGVSVSFEDAKRQVADGYRAVAPGWERWRPEFEVAGAPVTQALLAASRVLSGMRVLDVGCGVGEPALKLAQLAAPGQVVGIDLVPEMIAYASAAADAVRCANVAFEVADAESLPFANGTFDLVTSRSAIMHFPDPAAALAEVLRVLRPGGRTVFTALGPAEDTPVVQATIGVVFRHIPRKLSPRLVPDVYRFAVPGTLSSLLREVGFRHVHGKLIQVDCVWPGNAAEFWDALPDHAWGLKELLGAVAPDIRFQVSREAIGALRSYEVDGALTLRTPIVIVSGER